VVKWYIDKQSKKPLYLQLKELIVYYTNTGDIQDKQELPGIRYLAEQMGITYETVRKALKELESDGLITMERGKSSAVTLFRRNSAQNTQRPAFSRESMQRLRDAVQNLYREGLNLEQIKEVVDHSFHQATRKEATKYLIFAECNRYQIREVSKILRQDLNIDVRPVLIREIQPEILQKEGGAQEELLGIITTTFHIHEIRRALGPIPIYLDTIHIKMSAGTKEKLNEYVRHSARIGAICLNDVMSYYSVMLKVELGEEADVTLCPFEDKPQVQSLIQSVDALVLSPSIYEEIARMAPAGLPVFNFLDEVDPLSIKLIKQRIEGLI
jgi:DNA-binding transcriptional regulator YhcF (GntR family)